MSRKKIEVVVELNGTVSQASLQELDLSRALAAIGDEVAKLGKSISATGLRLELEYDEEGAERSGTPVRVSNIKSYVWSSRTL